MNLKQLGINICNFVAGLCVTLLLVSVAMVVIVKMKKLNEKSLLPLVALIAAFLLISLCYFVKSEDYRLEKMATDSFFENVNPEIRRTTEKTIDELEDIIN